MCRISGTVGYPKQEIERMLTHQHRGGPDYSSHLSEGGVILGHNLLSVIGHEIQPVQSARYWMSFNGCIYNYKELDPYSTSDTVTLLNQFEKKGLKALDDLNGMWAIGLHDNVENKIHLIVDRFGQKQLYYYHYNEKFAFASNPGALYPLLNTKIINKDALQSYWLLGSVMGEDGILQGIKKVCAGEVVTFSVTHGTVKRKRWYEPKPRKENIEELVVDAIDKVKVADVPVYIFLSGGVDSTLVASRFSGGNAIHLDSPEREYAIEVAKKYNISLNYIFPDDFNPEDVLTDYSTFSGEPTMAGMIPYITSKEVSKKCRVAVTANGADELFFGYDRTSDVIQDKQIKHIFRSLSKHFKVPALTEFDKHNYHGRMLELETYVQFDLNKTLDFASMCHGVEMRSPFLDHRLVEAALTIPEAIHKKKGNKTILKDMLRKYGFSDKFVDRPKVGFSLHKRPMGMDVKIRQAWQWVKKEGFLTVDDSKLNGRDKTYLEMSALGFYYWFKTIYK